MAFDISEIVDDPDLGECFTILRTSGAFAAGGWQPDPGGPAEIPGFGVVMPMDDEALQQVPEGDRVLGSMQLFCSQPIYETLVHEEIISDKVRWHGNMYRVTSRQNWRDFGYWSAVLLRMTGA